MKLSRADFAWSLASLTIMALSLGLSFAHVMEAPPRLAEWPPELWRETTVFHGQYAMFGILGGPIDVGSILLGFIVVYLIGRHDRPAFPLALAGSILFLVSLAVWLSVVAPANARMAGWLPGPLPEDFASVQLRWETGHMVMAGLKLAGFLLMVAAILVMRREPRLR